MTDLPHDATGVCDCCGEPGIIVDGECDACRNCHCGAPATIAHLGRMWCDPCAKDAGYIRPLNRQWEAA